MDYLECWYRAQRSAHGIAISTTNAVKAKQRLYQARTNSCDPSLKAIAICTSPTDPNELWLVKKPNEA